jgi:glycyl-tRNA synthetase beta chain
MAKVKASAQSKKSIGFVLEIGVEELPSRHCVEILKGVSPRLKELANSVGLELENPQLLLTPRRVVLLADTVSAASKVSEVKGPPAEVAMTDGKYNAIAQKFAEKNAGGIKDLEIREAENKKYVFFRKQIEVDIEESIGKLALLILYTPSFDRGMRWDNSGLEFSRPVRWLLSLKGSEIMCFDIHGISSCRTTYGPRFSDSKEITIATSAKYLSTLAANKVIVEHAVRAANIRKSLNDLAKKGLVTIENPEKLLEEITFLVENPLPILCEFEERFLDLPAEVIEAVLVKHQRYFPLYSKKSGKITNKFLVIANHIIATPEIKAGNEKVIKARLSDGLFFYDQDNKFTLDYFNKLTSEITFQEELGSLFDKAERVGKLAKNLPSEFANIKTSVVSATNYMKADQSTTLVSEFSSLEGVVGKIYALREGIDPRIASALEEYYHPRFAGDKLPASEVGQLLAILDRYDTLYGLFSIGHEPKGTSDPYGLRRAAIGLARILWEADLKLNFKALEKMASKVYAKKVDSEKLNKFVADRLVEEIRTSNPNIEIKYLRSIMNNASDYLFQKREVLEELVGLMGSTKLEEFLDFAKRVYNITVKQKLSYKIDIRVANLNTSEKALYLAAKKLEDRQLLSLADLMALVKEGNEFFVKNMIMSEVESEKERRIAILNLVNRQISRVIAMDFLLHKD